MNDNRTYATGSYVRVRDEDWLVTEVSEPGPDGTCLTCIGASALVADEHAQFFTELDEVTELKPEHTRFVDDTSRNFTWSRLYLEAVMRRAALPRSEQGLALADRFVLDAFDYQQRPAQMALENLRPRLLIADVVGLGKTLEIGLLLAELIRRGRGRRILVVVPQQIVDQFQRELWTRFAIPLLRMDSEGIARVQQQLPAGRNPFEFHQRIIISVDTLKLDRYQRHLEKISWDAVVFDESHNLIGGSGGNTYRKKLARLVSTTTEALIFASATPHPGKNRAFADLIDMLDPTRIVDRDNYTAKDIDGLFIRRTKTNPEVQSGLRRRAESTWAERGAVNGFKVEATQAEAAVFAELEHSWLRSDQRRRADRHLFAYTLLKAFFSSPAALIQTVEQRLGKVKDAEKEALKRLKDLAAGIDEPAKLPKLLQHLRAIGIGKGSGKRVVIFSERHQTLDWLRERICAAFGMDDTQVRTLRGTTPDNEATDIVESFGLGESPIRVLITGDIASEGVNLHEECHQLIHWDLPWSLIRIEQRNGRIDRYGQRYSPEFAALMLRCADSVEWDESRVTAALIAKEAAANDTLGSVEAELGHNDASAEEDRLVLAILGGEKPATTAVAEATVDKGDLSRFLATNVTPVDEASPPPRAKLPGLFPDTSSFVTAALSTVEVKGDQLTVSVPDDRDLLFEKLPEDLLQRITRVLPPRYVKDQKLTERLYLTYDKRHAKDSLHRARRQGNSAWPDLSYLSDLHPVVEWLTDRTIIAMGRDQAPIVYADVPTTVYCVEGLYTNGLSQSAVVEWMAVSYFDDDHVQVDGLVEYLRNHGVDESLSNPARPTGEELKQYLQKRIPVALEAARTELDLAKEKWSREVQEHIKTERDRVAAWEVGVLTGLRELEISRANDEAKARGAAETQRESIEKLDVTGEPLLRVAAVLLPTN